MFRRDPVADGKIGPVNAATNTVSAIMGKNRDDKTPNSKAWIAGAVLGPIFLLALVGLGFFLLARRRRKRAMLLEQDRDKAPPYSEAVPNGHDSAEKSFSVAHVGAHQDAKYGDPINSVELAHTQSPIAEMDESQGPMPELHDTQRAGPVFELESPAGTNVPSIRIVPDTPEMPQGTNDTEASAISHANNGLETTEVHEPQVVSGATQNPTGTDVHESPAVTDTIASTKGIDDFNALTESNANELPNTTDAPETPIMTSATEAPKRTDELFLESGDEKTK
jgi:hypothetical protein